MAGKKKTLAIWTKLQEERDELLEGVARGVTQRALAARLGCSTRIIYQYFHRADILPLYHAALAARASAMADDCMAIADEEPRIHPATGAIDPADVANRKLRITTRQWQAGKLDPSQWGEKVQVDGQVQVQHSIGSFLAGIKGDRLGSEPITGEVIASDLIGMTDD